MVTCLSPKSCLTFFANPALAAYKPVAYIKKKCSGAGSNSTM